MTDNAANSAHLQPPPHLPGLYWIILIVAINSVIQTIIIATLIAYLYQRIA